MFQTKPNLRDGILLAVIGALAVLFALRLWISPQTGTRLSVVTPEGETVYALNADRTETLYSNGYTLILEIKDGKARVTESDCPDRICVKSGWIEKSGETVICAPAGVRLTVTEGGTDGVDLVVG